MFGVKHSKNMRWQKLSLGFADHSLYGYGVCFSSRETYQNHEVAKLVSWSAVFSLRGKKVVD